MIKTVTKKFLQKGNDFGSFLPVTRLLSVLGFIYWVFVILHCLLFILGKVRELWLLSRLQQMVAFLQTNGGNSKFACSVRDYIFYEIWDTIEFGPGIGTHNLLIFGLTTTTSCQGAPKKDSCLPKLLIWRVSWIVSITQALRMTDAESNFYILWNPRHFPMLALINAESRLQENRQPWKLWKLIYPGLVIHTVN